MKTAYFYLAQFFKIFLPFKIICMRFCFFAYELRTLIYYFSWSKIMIYFNQVLTKAREVSDL